ncbi:zinc-dependent peptidase [Dyella telluris]|uniref:Zinc-dependent peptidase n=1 Tax=Dyella telluris TaxID=2763498 RepID=A0A7G8Q7P5_9GAMM|nr:M90 family metallopeptidase [Dyella telluris]QNK02803.1 zinc-dependent peptidase [Dyella telluris]
MPAAWWRRLRAYLTPPPLADEPWRHALDACLLAQRLDSHRQRELRRLVSVFLARKRFHALAGAELSDEIRTLIAMQACLPVLKQGPGALKGWRDILVYPGEFKVKRSHHDDRTGVVTESDGVLIGEAWEHGPLVLSLADVQLDLAQPWDGFNVVIHEIAHKLDMLDGPPDGVPVLPPHIPRRQWIVAFQRAFDLLSNDVARGRDTLIDPYASESADEFFAVVSELHWSQPGVLRRADAAVADLLQAYYGVSPAG